MITVRPARQADLPELTRLYLRLEAEMGELHEMWPIADGLPAPHTEALRHRVESPEHHVFLGLIDDSPFGFVMARLRPLLPQAGEEPVGMVELVFTEPEARDVGLAEAMLETALDRLESQGARRFDAPVLPGHRRAKNFFERAGFAARSITMHRRPR